MARSVEQIEQELATLDQSVAAIAQALHDAYSQYLTALGQATRRQLILAGFHICTTGYPEQFLQLSLHQRQELQQALQQLASQVQAELLEQLRSVDAKDSLPAARQPDFSDLAEQLAEKLDESTADVVFLSVSDLPDSLLNSPPDSSSDSPPDSDFPDAPEKHGVSIEVDHPSAPDPLTPKHLVGWQQRIEAGIIERLQAASHAANRLFQRADILPNRLPEPVLEVAAKADLSAESTASLPNLLNLLVETETEDGKEHAMTQMMAIRLRLSEIEFADPSTAVWRSKLRNLSTQLNKLGRDYQKKQKERSIAQAEIAWRSSWFEG